MRAATVVSVIGAGLIPAIGIAHGAADHSCKAEWSPAAASCSWKVVEMERPFAVRRVRGTLANQAGGLWPQGTDVVIELADSRSQTVRYLAHVGIPSGKFNIRNVRAGEYCFRIAVRPAGWSCVQRRVTVSPGAPTRSRVDVTVPLGQ
jgi:hypothetical protein